MTERRASPRDLTDTPWALRAPLVERRRRADGRGRPREVELRAAVNAILGVLREGGRWRALPHDFPAWQPASWSFTPWTDDGTLLRA